jgi:hypothetical protein
VGPGRAFPLTLLPDSHPLLAGVHQLAMDFIHVSEGDLPPETAPYEHWVLPLAPFLLVGPSVEALVRSTQPYEQGSYLAAAFVYPLEQGEVLFWQRCFDYGRFDGPTLKRNFDSYITTFPGGEEPAPSELPLATCPDCQHQFKRDVPRKSPDGGTAKAGKIAILTDPSQLKALIGDPGVATLTIAPNLSPDQFPTEARDALILWVSSGHRAYGCGGAMGLFGLVTERMPSPQHLYGNVPYRCVVKMPEDYHPIVTGVRHVQLVDAPAELLRVPSSEPTLVGMAGGRGPGNYLSFGEPGSFALVALTRLGDGEVLYWSPGVDTGSLDGPILKRNTEAYLKTFPHGRLAPDEEVCPNCGALAKM